MILRGLASRDAAARDDDANELSGQPPGIILVAVLCCCRSTKLAGRASSAALAPGHDPRYQARWPWSVARHDSEHVHVRDSSRPPEPIGACTTERFCSRAPASSRSAMPLLLVLLLLLLVLLLLSPLPASSLFGSRSLGAGREREGFAQQARRGKHPPGLFCGSVRGKRTRAPAIGRGATSSCDSNGFPCPLRIERASGVVWVCVCGGARPQKTGLAGSNGVNWALLGRQWSIQGRSEMCAGPTEGGKTLS